MHLFIPTMCRALSQKTRSRLEGTSLLKNTLLVVPIDEIVAHAKLYGSQMVLGTGAVGIGPTRDAIFEWARERGLKKIVQLDDDLTFQRLRPSGKIDNCSPAEVEQAFSWLSAALETHAHAGFAVRFSDKGASGGDKSPARMMHVLGYNLDIVPKDVSFVKGVRDPAHYTMDDFNMTLQLLTRGYKNIVSHEWRTSPSAGNATGGASTYRTLQSQNASARNLNELFPRYAALRQKNNWQGMDGGEMIDVTVQWKAAFVGSLGGF